MKVKIRYIKPTIEEIEVDDKFAELIKTVKEAKVRSGYPWDLDEQAVNYVSDNLDPQGKGVEDLWKEVYSMNDTYEIDTIYTDDGIIIS